MNTREQSNKWRKGSSWNFYYTPSGHPFGDAFPLSFFVQMCSDVFGPKFTSGLLQRGVDLTMAEYGGRDVAVTNVVFVHGSLDPWHALGITEDVSSAAPAILIKVTNRVVLVHVINNHV